MTQCRREAQIGDVYVWQRFAKRDPDTLVDTRLVTIIGFDHMMDDFHIIIPKSEHTLMHTGTIRYLLDGGCFNLLVSF